MKKMKDPLRAALYSGFAHALCVALVLFILKHGETPTPKAIPIELEVQNLKFLDPTPLAQKSEVKKIAVHGANPAIQKFPEIDIRPEYMKGNRLFGGPQTQTTAEGEKTGGATHSAPGTNRAETNRAETNSTKTSSAGTSAGAEALKIPMHVIAAFDKLAAQLNRNLDYPNLLVEQNVTGTASLDLYFDRAGQVDESNSRFSGSHTAVRGLLVKASRLALVEWYRSDAYRLNPTQFSGQHFHTDFSFSYTLPSHDQLDKLSQGNYQITKIRGKGCGASFGLDLTCVAMQAEGAVENLVSDHSRIKADLLKDTLAHYDDIGLSGINVLIRENS